MTVCKVCLKTWCIFQLLSHVLLFATPWTAACQASLSFTISWSLLKLMSTELVMPSKRVIPFSCLHSFPASGSFPASWLFTSGGPSIGASALASVLPMNIQGWFPLGLTGLISFQSKGLSRVFSSTTVWKHKLYKYVNYVNCFSKCAYHYSYLRLSTTNPWLSCIIPCQLGRLWRMTWLTEGFPTDGYVVSGIFFS